MKKAYLVKETTEEFTVRNGELKPIKRKVVKREVPPDIAAVKMFLNNNSNPLTNEQLQAEAQAISDLLIVKSMEKNAPAPPYNLGLPQSDMKTPPEFSGGLARSAAQKMAMGCKAVIVKDNYGIAVIVKDNYGIADVTPKKESNE